MTTSRGIEAIDAMAIAELYKPELDQLVAEVDEGQAAEVAAKAELCEAQQTAARRAAEDKVIMHERWRVHQRSKTKTRIREARLDELRDSAIAALEPLEATVEETFTAEVVIKGGTKRDAKRVLRRIVKLNNSLEPEDASKRLIVLGRLPLVDEVSDPVFPAVSFIDVLPDAVPVSLYKAHGQHHRLAINPGAVSQFFMSSDSMDVYERDSSGTMRLVDEDLQDIRFVRTASDAEALVGDRALHVPIKTLIPKLRLPTAVISGEAAHRFTTMLMENEFLRTAAVLAASSAEEDIKALVTEWSPEGTEVLKQNRETFVERLEYYMAEVMAGEEGFDSVAAQAKADLMFSRRAQVFLDVSNQELEAYVVSAMLPYVELSNGTLEVTMRLKPHNDSPYEYEYYDVDTVLRSISQWFDDVDFGIDEVALDSLPHSLRRAALIRKRHAIRDGEGGGIGKRRLGRRIDRALRSYGTDNACNS